MNPLLRSVAGLVLALSAGGALGAETGTLTPWILPTVAPASGDPFVDGSPLAIIEFKGHWYFNALTPEHGRELWKTDGTREGTELLADISPGVGFSMPEQFAILDDVLYFVANEPSTGPELWRTDGTATGTWLVVELVPGRVGGRIRNLRSVGGMLLFTANGASTSVGSELWRSDGTERGTVLVMDIQPGPFPSTPDEFTELPDGRILFVARGTEGRELWVTDGTQAGTVLYEDIQPGQSSSNPYSLTRAGDFVFFLTRSPPSETLWATNGKRPGVTPLLSVPWNSGFQQFDELHELKGKLYFRGTTESEGVELWTSDGTVEGTRILKDICPGSCSGFPFFLAKSDDLLMYRAEDGVHGTELWRSDGTPAGTQMVVDLDPNKGSDPNSGAFWKGDFYFGARFSSQGWELWKWSNGIVQLVKDLQPGSGIGGAPGHFMPLAETMAFAGNHQGVGRELLVTDGTAEGTQPLVEFGIAGGPYFNDWTRLGDAMLFTVNGAVGELWRTEGSASSTYPLAPLTRGSDIWRSRDFGLISAADEVYFVPRDGLTLQKIWKTDGTDAGTKPVLETGASSNPRLLTAYENGIAFVADDVSRRPNLWLFSEAEDAGARVVTDGGFIELRHLTVAGSKLFFSAESPSIVPEAWASDGTWEGTRSLLTTADGGSQIVSELTRMDATALFFTEGYSMLWRSDGTPESTYLLHTGLYSVGGASSMRPLAVVGDLALFSSLSKDGSLSLWRTDGVTPAEWIAHLGNEPEDLAHDFVTEGRSAWFFVDERDRGRTLWRSDGSTAGTHPVASFPSSRVPELTTCLLHAKGYLLFAGYTIETGHDLWLSDGVGRLIPIELAPGAATSNPCPVKVFEDKVLVAGTPSLGQREVHVFDIPTPRVRAEIDGARGEGDWYLGDVSVTWKLSGAELPFVSVSGCDDFLVDFDTTGETRECTLDTPSGVIREVVTIRRDSRPPTLFCPESVSAHLEPSIDAADETSGMERVEKVGPSGAASERQFLKVTARDRAGNAASCSVSLSSASSEPPSGCGCGSAGGMHAGIGFLLILSAVFRTRRRAGRASGR